MDKATNQQWDVFISYASEDRRSVAVPLASELRKLGVSVWLDQTELKLGDSLRNKIEEGLSKSRFGVVILSQAFFSKHYTNIELSSLAQREVDGEQVILPVWHQVTIEDVRRYSLPLADRIAANWELGIVDVTVRILDKIRPDIVKNLLQKFSSPELLPRLSTGTEVVAVVQGAHFSSFMNDDPESSEELDLISGFLESIQDCDVLDELGPGERIRTEYYLNEELKVIEAKGWSIHGRKVKRRMNFGGMTDNWAIGMIAVIRDNNKQVYVVGDRFVISDTSAEE